MILKNQKISINIKKIKMNSKIFSLLVLSIFLFSSVSAMTVYGGFLGGAQSATINEGNSIKFSASFLSMNLPMNIKIGLYNGENLIHTFLDTSVSTNTYSDTYSYTPSTAGTYSIQITGTDKVNSDYQSLTLTVKSTIPTPPTPTADTIPPIISILGSNPMTILQGSIYTDAGATAADNVDGDITSKIQVTGSVNTNIVGTYILTYDVKDNAGNSAISKTRIVYVISSNPQNNHAPIITSLPVKSVDEKQEYDYQIVASDSDGDSLTYSLVSAPSWLHINSATGFIYGIAPSVNSDAHYDVTVQVSDGTDSDTQSYTITVMDTSAVGNGNTRYLNDDFYNQNRYFDQFNTGKITVYNPAEKSNQAVVSLVIVCMTIGIALLIVLTAFILVLFYQEKPKKQQMRQSSEQQLHSDERYY